MTSRREQGQEGGQRCLQDHKPIDFVQGALIDQSSVLCRKLEIIVAKKFLTAGIHLCPSICPSAARAPFISPLDVSTMICMMVLHGQVHMEIAFILPELLAKTDVDYLLATDSFIFF
jgi:hypothetical protein